MTTRILYIMVGLLTVVTLWIGCKTSKSVYADVPQSIYVFHIDTPRLDTPKPTPTGLKLLERTENIQVQIEQTNKAVADLKDTYRKFDMDSLKKEVAKEVTSTLSYQYKDSLVYFHKALHIANERVKVAEAKSQTTTIVQSGQNTVFNIIVPLGGFLLITIGWFGRGWYDRLPKRKYTYA